MHLPERNRKQRPVSSTKQRNPTRCQQRDPAAGTTRRRWSAAAQQDGTKIPTRHRQGQSSHNAGRNAAQSHAAKAASSARYPDGRERNASGSQNALADGAACYQVARFYSVTHRKAPAANSPRNNVAGCRQPDAITRRYIKAPTPKNTARSNAFALQLRSQKPNGPTST